MLADWLSPRPLPDFPDGDLAKRPCAGTGTALDTVPLLTWEAFGRVLASDLPCQVLTLSGGRPVSAPRPTSLGQARALLRRGIGVVVRGSEQHDPDLARLAESFGRSQPGEVHVQLHATPAGASGGWRRGAGDVFIAQTAGIEDHYFRAHDARRPARGLGRDRSLIFSARLEPGDWLYVPAHWWHLVQCVEDALSISVGVRSPPLRAGWPPS
jgi:hypothetical protein